MLEYFRNIDSSMIKGSFVAVAGLLGVFLVLVLFYVMIKLLLMKDKK